MLTPEELQQINDTIIPIFDNLSQWINSDIIRRICARLGRGEDLTLTGFDAWQSIVMQEAGGHLEELQKKIAQITKVSEKEIKELFEEYGIKSVNRDNTVISTSGMDPIKLEQSSRLINILEDAYRRTSGDIRNITKTSALNSQKRLIDALDNAYYKVSSGSQSYTSAIKDVIEQIAKENSYVNYESGAKRSIESVVSSCLRTGIGQATGNMSISQMQEYEWDIVLVSSHYGARCEGDGPQNHAKWQGQFYSLSGKSSKFKAFYQTTGYGTITGLCGANCRHSFGAGDGEHNAYNDIDSEKNKKIYELSQKQRKMETSIRNDKRELIGIKEGIDNIKDERLKFELQQKYDKVALKMKTRTDSYKTFCGDNNLRTQQERLNIANWNREQSLLARNGAKREKYLIDKK